MDTPEHSWARFLDPEFVRPKLFSALMFIATFEILKDSTVDRLKDFYSIGFDQQGPTISPDYQTKVLNRHKNSLYATFDWLRESGAIDEADLELYEELRKVRNTLAHELFAAVTGQIESDHVTRLSDLFSLLRKIEVWWIVNLDLPANPDYDGQEVDEAGIVPGSILALQMLAEVAAGNTELLEYYRGNRPTPD